MIVFLPCSCCCGRSLGLCVEKETKNGGRQVKKNNMRNNHHNQTVKGTQSTRTKVSQFLRPSVVEKHTSSLSLSIETLGISLLSVSLAIIVSFIVLLAAIFLVCCQLSLVRCAAAVFFVAPPLLCFASSSSSFQRWRKMSEREERRMKEESGG